MRSKFRLDSEEIMPAFGEKRRQFAGKTSVVPAKMPDISPEKPDSPVFQFVFDVSSPDENQAYLPFCHSKR